MESFLQGYTESKEKNADRDFLIPLLIEDNIPDNLPPQIQAHIKAKMYIDARKLKEAKDIDLFQKRLLFVMPKVPLKKFSKHNVTQELNINDWRSKLPPLYNRVYKYNEWKAKNESNKEKHNKKVNMAIIEVDPEDPEYLNDDDDDFNGVHHRESSDDNDDNDCDGANVSPTAVVVEAAVHANF